MGKKLTQAEFKKDIESKGYILLSEFKGTKNDIKLAHYSESGEYHEYTTQAKLWRKGCRCPKCNKERLSDISQNPNFKSKEKFRNDLFKKYGNTYELISEYRNNKDICLFRHNMDDGSSHEFSIRAGDLLNNGIGCNKCAKNHKRTTEEFKEEILALTKGTIYENQIELISEYKSSQEKVTFLHKECGRKFEMRPDDFKNGGQRCPFCRKSKGEETIERYLIDNSINYMREYKLDGCKNKRLLPFDFAVFDSDNKLVMLIEFDGEQHFTDRYFGKEQFEKTKENDQIKNKFCIENNIPLLRIKYDEITKMDQILNENLNIYLK